MTRRRRAAEMTLHRLGIEPPLDERDFSHFQPFLCLTPISRGFHLPRRYRRASNATHGRQSADTLYRVAVVPMTLVSHATY